MQVIFIRHGEPDLEQADRRGFIGMGRDMAPLTELGREQAKKAAQDPRLAGAQLIVSSPYTRALQTAAEVSRQTGLEIRVEVDLHEMIPDKTFQVKGAEENHALHLDFIQCQGEYPAGERRKWETVSEGAARTRRVLDRYLEMGYDKIIVAAHGGVIRRYTGELDIAYCGISQMEYNREFQCYGWVQTPPDLREE